MNTQTRDTIGAKSVARVTTLVVDDSPLMLKALSQILEQTGNFDLVGSATDGCQALRHVSLLSPDLVLMDAHMPRFNGIQATRCIKRRAHPPIVIIVTSDDSPITKASAEEAGADGFIIKDQNLRHRLLTTLQELFGPNGASCAKTCSTAIKTGPQSNKTLELSLCSPLCSAQYF